MNKIIFFLITFLSLNAYTQNFAKAWEPIQKRIDNGESFSNEELNSFLKKHEKDLESNKIEKSIIYDYLGSNAFKEEKYPEAIQLFNKAIDITKEINDTIYRAFYQYDLACLYNHVGYYTTAEPLFIKSLPTLAAVYGQSSIQYTMRFKVLAEMYVEMGKYNEAKMYNDALLYYFKTMNGEKDREYLICLNNDARINEGYGDYTKALEIFEKLMKIHASLNPIDTADYITIINNTAEAHRHLANYDEAIKLQNKALELSKKFSRNDDLSSATIYNNLGLCYKAISEFQKAEESFDNCTAIYKKLKLDFVPDYTNSLSNKADLYRMLGRYKQAFDLLLEVIGIRKNSVGTKHVNYANALSNMALVHIDQYDYDGGEKYLLEAKEIYKEVLGEYHPYYANCINSLGTVYAEQKRYKEAEKIKLRSLEIMKQMTGEDNERYAYYLRSLGIVYFRQNNYKQAIECIEKSNDILKKKFGEKHIDYTDGVYNLAVVKWKINDFQNSKGLFIQSLDNYKEQFDKFFESMSEDEQNSYYQLLEGRFDEFTSFVFAFIKAFPKENHGALLTACYDYQLFIKSLPLNRSINTRKAILSSNDTALVNTYNKWLNTKQLLSGAFRDLDFQNSYWNMAELEQQAAKLEQELKSKTNLFTEKKQIRFKDIKDKLQNNEGALSILRRYNNTSDTTSVLEYVALFVNKNSTAPIAITFKNSELFESDYIDFYREQIENRKEDLKSYERFWKPIVSQLTGITKLYVSTDGVFNQINLYSLQEPISKSYVLDQVNLTLVPNLSNILDKASINNNNSAILFGNPDYEYDFKLEKTQAKTSAPLAVNRFGFSELPALPGTQTEVDNISSSLKENKWQTKVYIDKFATEAQLKKVQSPKVLHIATHGFFLKDVMDNEDKSILGFETTKLKSNPLLRSGIMMAGASVVARDTVNIYKEQDGIFTAYEASLLNLYNTDLVVLSACETGLGVDMNNQGVFGLQRAFYIAGAKNLIMSLWVVDDEATQILMSEFYKNWSMNPSRENISPAFKKAQAEVRKKYPHPYYWAAFVLLGN